MNTRLLVSIAAAVFSCAAVAQDAAPGASTGQNQNPNSGGGYGPRGGRGGMGAGMGMMGRGLVGTVTDVAADHYTIKTDVGDIYTVHLDANTRILKQPAGSGMRAPGSRGDGAGQGGSMGGRRYGGGTPPQEIKAADIKAGDMIRAAGEVDAAAKTVNARSVMQLDPATAAQMRDMEANFGKTWLAGTVTAIDGVKITITGSLDHSPHTVVADENTEFRRRRDPITLADIHVGDTVRVEGAVKDGTFTATSVNLAGMRGEGEGPGGPPSAPPQ